MNEQANRTKEGVEVRAGQIWMDLDKRMSNRFGLVQEVKNEKAIMAQCTENGRVISSMRLMTISIRRMHKSSAGWSLIREAPALKAVTS